MAAGPRERLNLHRGEVRDREELNDRGEGKRVHETSVHRIHIRSVGP